MGIAGLEECPTKKAWCNTDAGSSSWCSSGFFNLQGVSLRCRLSHNVCPAPVRLHASASMHMLKPLPLAAMPLFPHIKILHPLTGVGSAALAAALPYPGMAIWISPKGQWKTKNLNKNTGLPFASSTATKILLNMSVSPATKILINMSVSPATKILINMSVSPATKILINMSVRLSSHKDT